VATSKVGAGFIDKAEGEKNRSSILARDEALLVAGWAVDLTTRQPAKQVWVLAGDRILGSAATSGDRADVAKHLGSSAYRSSGWALRVARDQLPDDASLQIEAYALMQDGRRLVKLGGARSVKTFRFRTTAELVRSHRPAALSAGFVDVARGRKSGARTLDRSDTLWVAGWSFDPVARLPPKQVWIVAGDAILAVARTGGERPDVERAMQVSSARRSGWEVEIEGPSLPRGDATVEAYAVLHDKRLARLNGHAKIRVRD
jgi:hypothetical protein